MCYFYKIVSAAMAYVNGLARNGMWLIAVRRAGAFNGLLDLLGIRSLSLRLAAGTRMAER
jgi:hypothetical protein